MWSVECAVVTETIDSGTSCPSPATTPSQLYVREHLFEEGVPFHCPCYWSPRNA